MSTDHIDEDAALQQYIWVSTNTPGGWESDTEPVLTPNSQSEHPGPSFPTFTSYPNDAGSSSAEPAPAAASSSQSPKQEIPKRRRRRTKQCRICLDTETDEDENDPEVGRLISPCKCKGSARYVHEGCLRAWRLQSANSQSFYKCPTCHYEYKFRRLKIAQVIGSAAVQIGVTGLIFLVTVYLLGFIADPIINLYVNPWYAVDGGNMSFTINGFTVYGPSMTNTRNRAVPPVAVVEKGGFLEHMVRGMSALGLIGFAKVLVFSHHWIRYVFGGQPGVARRGDGRDRMAQLSWVIIIWGVVNFLIFVWGYVRNWTKGILDKIAIGVADIGGDDDDNDDDEIVNEPDDSIKEE